MFENFKAWYGRLVAGAKIRFAGWFLPKQPFLRGTPFLPGTWLAGEHRESSGHLVYAPLISPKRGYRVYFPAGYRKGEHLPLIVMLHGCKQDSESFAAGTRINLLADRARFIALYPEQTRLANPYHCWNWFDPSSHRGNGEAAIIAGMVRGVAKEHNVDSARIYVAGLSAGGALASALASCYPHVFAACAIHSGLMFQAAGSPSAALPAMRNGSERDPDEAGDSAREMSGDKGYTMPVLVIHGDADEIVHPVNAEQIIAQFLAMNRHPSENNAALDNSMTSKIERSNGSGYRYEVRDDGPVDAPLLRRVIVKGMGHAWSGGNPSYPYNDPRGPDASEMMLEFFDLHRRETPTESYLEEYGDEQPVV